jgi:hypothetical protein
MTRLNIAVRRLHSQQLERPQLKKPGEVVAWLVAAQAQDYAGAKWSIGLRLPGSTDASIEQAIANKTIVRTWALRGTLHFVAAADIRWLLALVAPRVIAGNARRYRELELDEQMLARSNAVLSRALRTGKPLTRTALFVVLQQNGISTQGQRGVYMLQRASLDGLICQGVMRGKDPTFMPLDASFPKIKKMRRDEALAELARRYFTSRGPATLQDFVWWSGLSTAEASAGLEAVKSRLAHESFDGRTYWLSRSRPAIHDRSPTTYLLPGFDEYLLSYKDRSASLDVPRYNRLTPPNGMLPSTIVIDGRVVSTWKRTLKKDSVVIAAHPFAALTAAEGRAFAVAAHRYGEFLGRSVVL